MIETTELNKYNVKPNDKKLKKGTCIFPFKFNRKLHYECIDRHDGHWCATKVTKKKKMQNWAFCKQKKQIKNKKTIKNKSSYSPNINKLLVESQNGNIHEIFGCYKPGKQIKFVHEKLNINLGTKKNPNCLPYYHPKVIQRLLNNLSKQRNFSCNNIISPKQIQNNCWFNSFFINFFISDKGKKFFKFFRQLMIKGKHSNGDPIKPLSLRKAFFLFNLSIEAILHSNVHERNLLNILSQKNESFQFRDEALLLDTNEIIKYIYFSLENHFNNSEIKKNIPNNNQYGNPLLYYKTLIKFLGDQSIHIADIFITNEFINQKKQFNLHKFKKYIHHNSIPDIYILSIWNTPEGIQKDGAPHVIKPLEFNINQYKYRLDSIIMYSLNKNHFVSYITCHNKDFYFDGGTYLHLQKKKWKSEKIINQNKIIQNGNVNLNFSFGYQILFYYRIE